MDLLLFGIQGSGKGTQGQMLVERFGFHFFEAGAELRKIIASGSELGKTIASYIDHGNLVPYQIMMDVMRDALDKIPADTTILFDGIPRDVDQKKYFDSMMQSSNRTFHCIELIVDESVVIHRLLTRGKVQGRMDDQDESSIRKRMSIFHEKTKPLIEEYRARGLVSTIDANATPAEVDERIRFVLARLGYGVR